jgi:hypothetical protein
MMVNAFKTKIGSSMTTRLGFGTMWCQTISFLNMFFIQKFQEDQSSTPSLFPFTKLTVVVIVDFVVMNPTRVFSS